MSPDRRYAIGVDTGGTHTDLVLAGEGRLLTLKVASTPADLTEGIVDGVRRLLAQAGVAAGAVDRFVYASTFVTNLFIEGRQAPVGLITTAGFRDVLQIGRASRKPDVYDIHWRPARPLVPRPLRFGVVERMGPGGAVEIPLDEVSARDALVRLREAGVEAIAVCLLHAYANPVHERRIAALAAELCPGLEVSLSSDVVREFREYERTSTTCVNAFVKGPITAHLKTLAAALRAEGVPAEPAIMRGNGGLSTFASASVSPTLVTHSGVMGGIVGANALAARVGVPNLITLDMGGTSADVSLIADGRPTLSHRSQIGPHPLLAPTLDMVTIGAGGGSIAWLAGGSALRVGPQSAGSVPGPACYGQGGMQPTVTDANLVAGRLNGDFFLGGARRLDRALAERAIDAVAAPLGLSREAAALGILAIAEAHMANAIRLVSVERGLDPRDFTLVAFGGAGALHAARLAEALSIREVLIPPAPGNLSAMGLLCADVRHDHARTLFAKLERSLAPTLATLYDELIAEADASLAADGVPAAARSTSLAADLRYEGQNYELMLPIDRAEVEAEAAAARGEHPPAAPFAGLIDRFNRQHEAVYGYRLDDRAVQLVSARVTATGAVEHAVWPALQPAAAGGEQAVPGAFRLVLVDAGVHVEAAVHRFDALRAGQRFEAPAIIEYVGSTLFVPPGWQGRLDALGNVRLSRLAGAGEGGGDDDTAAGRPAPAMAEETA